MGEGGDTQLHSELPFSREEYEGRLCRVRTGMQQRGVDLLYVTSPSNLLYLADYESVCFDGRLPTGLIVTLDSPPVLCDSPDHRALWRDQLADTLELGPDSDPLSSTSLQRILSLCHERSWLKGTAALEFWSPSPAPPVLRRLAGLLASRATVVDGSWIVDRVRLVKSPQELGYVRRAAAIVDEAMAAVRGVLEPGVSELEIAAYLHERMARHGGEEAALRAMVRSGPRSDAYHGAATSRRLEPGDMVMIETCGVCSRYHAGMGRAFSLGDRPMWREAMERVAEAVPALVDELAPGSPLEQAQRILWEHVVSAGLEDRVWWVGGYAMGIATGLDWAGHVFLDPKEGLESHDFVSGFVCNCDCLFRDEVSHEACGFVDTLVMTDKGIEVPTQFHRTLTVL